MKYFTDKIQGHRQNSGAVGRHQPSGGCHPCMPCGWSSSWQGSHPSSSSCHLMSPSSPCGTCGSGDASHPLWCSDVCETGGVLEPWESAAGALESFLGVVLVELLQLPSHPALLLGLLSEPAAGFLVMNPMQPFYGYAGWRMI